MESCRIDDGDQYVASIESIAVAVAEVRGADEALQEVEVLDLDDYVPYHATRADLLRRVGRTAEAIAAYDRAIALTNAEPERRYLARRRADLA